MSISDGTNIKVSDGDKIHLKAVMKKICKARCKLDPIADSRIRKDLDHDFCEIWKKINNLTGKT